MNWHDAIGILSTLALFTPVFIIVVTKLIRYKQYFPLFIYCLLAFGFVYFFVPETTGVSLEKIEENLMNGKRMRDIGQTISRKTRVKKLKLLMD